MLSILAPMRASRAARGLCPLLRQGAVSVGRKGGWRSFFGRYRGEDDDSHEDFEKFAAEARMRKQVAESRYGLE